MSIRHTVTGDSDDHLAALTIFLCQRNIIHTIHYPLYAEIINLHFHVWWIEWLSQLGEWVRTYYYLVASSLRIFEWRFLLSLLRHLYSSPHYSTRFSAKYSIIYSSNRLKYSDACTIFTHQNDLPAAVRYLIFRDVAQRGGISEMESKIGLSLVFACDIHTYDASPANCWLSFSLQPLSSPLTHSYIYGYDFPSKPNPIYLTSVNKR